MYFIHLPKIGSKGLAIPLRHRTEDWAFSNHVAKYMKRNYIQSCWFQQFDNNGWMWSHGIVELQNNKAIITQIG